ncbi:MAG: leucine-rich repeat domain-containing protein [Prevotellaceae bacterium]|nr:leucine-rich repeat domain-containing protein [Prevotellaceae bacterium]
MKKRNQRNIALRCFTALVLFLGVSIAAVAQDIAYITKNVDGVTGAQYCIEYKKVSSSGEWYANAIYTKGLTNAANAAAITFSIDGGPNQTLYADKFSTSGTTYSANVTQLSNPNATLKEKITASDSGIRNMLEKYPDSNFPICLGESSSTRLQRPYNVEMKGAFTTINQSAFHKDYYLQKFIVADGSSNIALNTIKGGAFAHSTVTEFRHAADQFSGKSYFPSAIRTIENAAFAYSGLTGELNLPSACATVEDGAFYKNANLTKVDVRDENGRHMVIGKFSFGNCPKLATVELSAKEIGDNAFRQNSGLKHVTFREGVEKIGYMAFGDMNSEDNMILPSTLKVIGDGPFGVRNDIPGWIFYNELTLPEGLVEIGQYAFSGMRSIQETLRIPDSVKKIGGHAFINAPIKHLEIGSGIEVFKTAPFMGCAFLETVIFKPNTVLQSGRRLFTKCNSLRYVRMDAVESAEFLKQFETKTINKEANDEFFGHLNPYTVVYLPKNFTDMNKLGSGVNDVNFVFYKDGNYTAPKFVVYDNHANYRTYNYKVQYPEAGQKMRVSPRTGAQYASLVDSPVLPLRGCDYEIPVTFTAQKASYNRTFSNPSQFYTVSLPYSPSWTQETMSKIKPFKMAHNLYEANGTTQRAYYFYSIDDTYFRSGKGASKLTDSEKNYRLTPYHGYLVKFYDNAGAASLFDGTDVKVYANDKAPNENGSTINEKGDWGLIGTTMNIYNAQATTDVVYYSLKGSTKTWHKMNAGNEKVFLTSFRAAVKSLSSAAVSGAAPFIAFFMEEGSTPTGIQQVEQKLKEGKTNIYTLDGRFVGTDSTVLPQGIYIVDGKKFYKM